MTLGDLYYRGPGNAPPVSVGGGGGGASSLSATLVVGNDTGGTNIVLTSGDAILGESGVGVAGNVALQAGTDTGAGPTYGGDVILRPGQGVGGGTDGSVLLINAPATSGIRFNVTGTQELSIGTTFPLVYNATTGKLTVPGLIDPTGVVFEEAAAPTTGGTEGAIFVSDGTGGLTLGDLYYRGPSNAAPVSVSGVGAPVTTYVFRPGGIASGNVYTDFNLLYTALSAVDGPKTILFDDTITSPVLIPPKSGGGFYSFRNVTAQGLTSTPGNSTLPGPIVRFNNDGVNQAQCDSFFDESTNIAWESNTLAGSPAVVIADVLTSHITLTKCWVSTSGAAPFFYIDGGGGFPITGLFIRMLESSLSGTTPVTVQVVNGGSLAIDAYQQSKVNDSLSTDATSYASVSYDSTFKVFNPQTNCAVGTYDFTPISYTLSDVVELRDASPGGNSVILAVTGSEELSVGTTFPLVYDGATGKLTVPGVIDPTAVVFEQAPAPATGATEGAIFFSDGTGGLTAGNLYVRPASSGTPADLTTAAASGSDFYANVWVAWKKPCRVATTANVTTLAGGAPLSVDGVSVTTGDRVLVWVQTTGSENGIYRVTVPGTGSDGTWVRDTDFDASADVVGGCMVYVQDGSQNSRTRFTLVTTGTINLGVTSLTFLQEAPLVRTDATSTAIIAAGTAFTSGTIVWSSALDTRDYSEVSVWFGSTNIGSNTQVDLYVQWSDDGTTIPFGDDDGIQQTDFLLTTGTNGVFQPKNYVARLTTAGGELVANSGKLLSFPKKGGSMRFGVMGNSATGTFGVRAQRLA